MYTAWATYHPSSAPNRKAVLWGDRRMTLPWTDGRLQQLAGGGDDGSTSAGGKYQRHHLAPITGGCDHHFLLLLMLRSHIDIQNSTDCLLCNNNRITNL
jgi:hypothetical protein